ncbi:dTMP kinase [Natranaerofaba carboxydovora]|uniref:dTMP kinase n=1 Tax=Natranaerofaba carboxydovora TaxID=2742683 RepID=UPI001F147A92|nr:hypothetical protein [Natranaerofaba carboxydovora]UMZ75238.1 Thymidylate kinase [Natranaerofaba carboxydovora]
MGGKLIVIESGSDASGKATQTKVLYNRLLKENYNVKKIEFPNYKSDSSALVKMYLNGDLGENPEDINPYAISTFYAVDRFASYKMQWEDFYQGGGVILADRYTTSNMVYQAAKFNNKAKKDEFLDWLWELEFSLYELPQPDVVFFLDIPPTFTKKLMKERKEVNGDGQLKDIHEENLQYLEQSYNNALYIADKYNWEKINCVKNNELMTIDEINELIYKKSKDYF